MIRLLIDTWVFTQAWEDEELPLSPRNEGGVIYTRAEWEDVKTRVDLFFSMIEDATIEEYNEQKRAANRREWEARNRGDGTPVSKPKKRRPGYIYLMRADTGHYKVGMSSDPKNRNKTLGTQMPYAVELLYTAKMEDMSAAEAMLHEVLGESRVNGEWFDLHTNDVEWLTSGAWLDDLELREECMGEERTP